MKSENLVQFDHNFSMKNVVKNKQYFEEMLQQESLYIAQPFLKEESSIIINIIEENSVNEFLGIGCGNGLYFDLIRNTCKYNGIDPHFRKNNNEKPLNIIKNRFEAVNLKRSQKKYLISFLFNLISYINPSYIVKFINVNGNQGDVITISTWNNTIKAEKLRQKYEKHITKKTNNETLLNIPHFIEIESNLISQIQYYKYHKLIELNHSRACP